MLFCCWPWQMLCPFAMHCPVNRDMMLPADSCDCGAFRSHGHALWLDEKFESGSKEFTDNERVWGRFRIFESACRSAFCTPAPIGGQHIVYLKHCAGQSHVPLCLFCVVQWYRPFLSQFAARDGFDISVLLSGLVLTSDALFSRFTEMKATLRSKVLSCHLPWDAFIIPPFSTFVNCFFTISEN